jgi:general secretion pathway protein A
MYTAFFGLREKPFALSPDPRFLYLSEAHREALAHLLYGIEQGEGFIGVTGEVGTGKTTLCRTLLRRLGGEVEVAFLFNPKLSAHELLEAVLVELGVELKGDRPQRSARELVDSLNQFLLEKRAAGKRVLLIVDEAQGLLPETLEQIRLLSNLETESDKLIQILLLGQPELDAMLESPELRQLRQRIGVRWRLAPLSRDETVAYVRHRLQISAGVERNHVFTDAALSEVYRFSGGIPRVVNLVCDRALLSAYAESAARIDAAYVKRAAAELRGDATSAPKRHAGRIAAALAAAAVALLAGALYWIGGPQEALRRLEALRAGEAIAVVTPVAVEAPVEPVAIEPPAVATPPPVEIAAPPAAAPEAAAPAAPTPARVDDLARALAQRSPGATAAASYAALLRAWSLAPPEPPPELLSFPELVGALVQHDLGVFSFTATDLDQLRVLDHPVLLGIEAADGVRRIVALAQLGDGEAELEGVVASGTVRVPVEELQRYWLGDAHLVWRDFEPLPDLLRPGDGGESVLWLQRALGEIGYATDPTSGYFDAATAQAVRAFQSDRGLDPDGAVGPLTKMAIYRALGRYAVPHVAQTAAVGDAG